MLLSGEWAFQRVQGALQTSRSLSAGHEESQWQPQLRDAIPHSHRPTQCLWAGGWPCKPRAPSTWTGGFGRGGYWRTCLASRLTYNGLTDTWRAHLWCQLPQLTSVSLLYMGQTLWECSLPVLRTLHVSQMCRERDDSTYKGDGINEVMVRARLLYKEKQAEADHDTDKGLTKEMQPLRGWEAENRVAIAFTSR